MWGQEAGTTKDCNRNQLGCYCNCWKCDFGLAVLISKLAGEPKALGEASIAEWVVTVANR